MFAWQAKVPSFIPSSIHYIRLKKNYTIKLISSEPTNQSIFKNKTTLHAFWLDSGGSTHSSNLENVYINNSEKVGGCRETYHHKDTISQT